MQFLVFSDSHGDTRLMQDIVAANMADGVIFLGDYINDCVKLQRAFPELKIFAVPGNCDFASPLPREVLLELGVNKIYLTHGHMHGVKSDYEQVAAAAAANQACACLFGHSHVPVLCEKNGILLLNPGSITDPRGHLGRSYAVLNILDGKVSAEIIEA